MKTAIAIDSLLLRDETIFLLELVLNLYPDSEIYTLVHTQGKILGPIETKTIVSSFLTHRLKNQSVLEKNFGLLPAAVKGIPIHPSIENMLVLSRGFIHGLKIPDRVKRKLYLLDWDLLDEKKLGWQKIFRPYVNDWREKSLTQFGKIAVSSQYLQQRLDLPNSQIIYPTFRTQEYPFVRDQDHHFNFTHHLIYTHDVSLDEMRLVLKTLSAMKEDIKILGPYDHLIPLKNEFKEVEFVGDHCDATNALYTHQAKVVWDLSQSFFPTHSLGAMACGRPVICRDHRVPREILTYGAYFIKDFSPSTLETLLKDIEGSYLDFDRNSLRRFGLKWNERFFKSQISNFFKN
jgi:glycosyltransferase involved in cell wall biosynthesis